MKKAISLLLALVMIFALCACGNDAPASTPNAGASAPADTPDASDTPDEPVWPTDDVTVYIPQQVGSGSDVCLRVVLDYLAEVTGATFIPVNDGNGAGAALAAQLAEDDADGLYMMFYSDGAMTTYYQGMFPFNMAEQDEFRYVCGLPGPNPESGHLIMTQPDAPYSSMQELVDYVNEHPGEVTCGIVAGKTSELKLKVLFEYYGIADKLRYVAATNSDLKTGLLGDNIDIGCMDESQGVAYVESGDLKVINFIVGERLYRESTTYTDNQKAIFDQMETLADIVPADVLPTLLVNTSFQCIVPKETPDEIVEAIREAIAGLQYREDYWARVMAAGAMNVWVEYTEEECQEHWDILNEQCKAIYGQ